MALKIIVATDLNGGIGADNKLLWHIPEDLKRFKNITNRNIVVMGRKTFESLPFENGLPNRLNVILTKDTTKQSTREIRYVNSISEIVQMSKHFDEYIPGRIDIFVIGGGEIYKQLLPFCDEIYLTKVFTETESDTFFKYNENDFYIDSESDIKEYDGLKYQFINLQRRA